MSSTYNVILVIVLGVQCYGIKVQSTNQNKVFLLLPKTTPIPPQLAYYVQNGRQKDSIVYNNNEHFDKSASTPNVGVLSVIDGPYSQRNRPPRLQQSNFGFVQKYRKPIPVANQPLVYQSATNGPPGSYNFQQYYGQDYGSLPPTLDSIVRATPPPERRPGRTPPPPSKKVTFQVNMLERNYRAQQNFERRNRDPHYRNQAIQQVEPPILTTEAPKNHQVLRTNINRLKKAQRQHFNVNEDEHPARQQITEGDDVEQITPKYDYKSKNFNEFRDDESQYDRLKIGHKNNDESSSNYEESEPKFTNFYDDIDNAAKYFNHGDFVTPASYQNYNNDHEDHFEVPNFTSKYENYEHSDSDEPTSKYRAQEDSDNDDRETFNPYKANIDSYGHKRYITNDEVKQFDKLLRSTPRYVGPKKKSKDQNSYNDRSDNGDEYDFVPYKMLASVRHSERYEHQPKDLDNPLLKERILEKGGHVVYTEQGYEDKQYDHGNEEKLVKIKHRKKRHVNSGKFPFYYSSTRKIPKYSAIRYAENSEHLRNTKASLYESKQKKCNDVGFDDSKINGKKTDSESKKRLIGLEDKIDCLKEKLFGVEPLSNPLFQEQFVDETVPLVKPRQLRSSSDEEPYSSLINVFDDVINNIKRSSTSNTKPDHVTSESNVDYVVFPPYVDLENSKLKSNDTSVFDIIESDSHNRTKPPVVLLMDKEAFAQMNKNHSSTTHHDHLPGYLKYPQSDGTEVFIFDISKFIPKLSIPDSEEFYDSIESITTTESSDVSISPKKSNNMKNKKRNHQRKSLGLKNGKYSSDRHTNVVSNGLLLARMPDLLPGSYDLHSQGKLFG